MTNFEAWTELTTLAGFVHFDDIGDAKHTDHARRQERRGRLSGRPRRHQPNPEFSLENLLSYHIAGDHRADENVALTAVHTVWHREHNFQAERIKALHPEWSDEQIFQAAKIIQTAEYQRVVFTEFAEAMSGGIPGPSHGFGGYNPDVNPGISDEFAGAMYRVGHSMINETIPFIDGGGQHAGGAAVLGLPEPGHVRRQGSAHRRRRRRGRHHRRRGPGRAPDDRRRRSSR